MTGAPGEPIAPGERLATRRLILRAWHRADAPALKSAIDAGLAELQQWMPWAREEPSALHLIESRLVRFRGEFERGESWAYGIFALDDREVLGGIGLHRRSEPGRLEIGYWVRTDVTGRGVASEAAAALTDAALALPGVDATEIRCNARNVRSAALPPRVGYRLDRIIPGDLEATPGAPRDTMVWLREHPRLTSAGARQR